MSLWPWVWPPDTAERALRLSILSLVWNAWQFYRTRRERVSIKAGFRYRINLLRDSRLYPYIISRHEPTENERCCLLTVTYHGRHSVDLLVAEYEIACSPGLFRFDPRMERCTLYDGQSKRLLLLGRRFDLRDVTAFTITTRNGMRSENVHGLLRHQFRIEGTHPRLFRMLKALTGVPHLAVSSDMNPRRCPRCWAGRRHLQTSQAEPFEPIDGLRLISRRFQCAKCRHQWSAHEQAPGAPTEPPG